ncbi:hypothetical protein [Clostridium beijerinckii]|uniref:hypothetical protein n=1 Tax=Clostridium beijerinckii TaxID=1520 RepID=UPI00080A0865|nr:hypothetical protein [Clostridium beijerinckii]OCA98619.1 hypothetical protein BGS1_11300 [Clostridium beijerinckii]
MIRCEIRIELKKREDFCKKTDGAVIFIISVGLVTIVIFSMNVGACYGYITFCGYRVYDSGNSL